MSGISKSAIQAAREMWSDNESQTGTNK